MDTQPSTPGEQAAPSVVAVVVTCDPGWWLEECLISLGDQDYPELSVLVIDADSVEDPTSRVAAVMPVAYVRRLRRRRGFAGAANEVLGVVDGASHYLLCHDDVALEPDAVRLMVQEAYRSNAGVVAPKLVGWFAPDRLLAAGMGADGFGVPVALVERGELDQRQHDVARDVFFAPSSCSLVRADLFATLGGFDVGYGVLGEDLDLGWRAHLAGARVVVAPAARVRHLEATESGQRALDGALRPEAADAVARAGALGFGPAPYPEDPGLALAPASLGAGVAVGGPGAPDPAPAGMAAPRPPPGAPPTHLPAVRTPPEPAAPSGLPTGGDGADAPGSPAIPASEDALAAWDLGRWDLEDDREPALPAGSVAPHHASRRSRREAGRGEGAEPWVSEEDPWEPSTRSSRRRARRAARVGGSGAGGRPDGRRAVSGPSRERLRRPDADAFDDRRAEARLRAIAVNYGFVRLVARFALLVVLTSVEAVDRLLRRGPESARATVVAWESVIRASRTIRSRRAVVRRARTGPDGVLIAPLQFKGIGRVREALRPSTTDDAVSLKAAALGGRPANATRWSLGVGLVVTVVLVFGTRRLIVGHLPTIGELGPWPDLPTMARTATSGWRSTGLGTSAAAPTALALLTLAGAVFLGHMVLLQHLLVLGLVPLGALGMARLARPIGSQRASAVAVVAFLVIPLPYDALAGGRWSGLVAYAAFPWVIGLLARATALAPFARPVQRLPTPTGGRSPRPWLGPGRRIVALALLTAVAGAIEPAMVPMVALAGVALAAASVLAGPLRSGTRAAATALGGAVGACGLLVPWSVGWLPPSGEWAGFSGVSSSAGEPLSRLLRFQTGPVGAGVLGYAALVVAALPLIVGRDWRAAWAVRLWVLAVGSFALAWAGQHAALGIGWPPPEVLLAPAAVALALAAALGMASFDADLSGYDFGWRQGASLVAAGAAGLACIPILGAASGGRWGQPATGFDAVLSWMPAKRAAGDFRVLWIGQASDLPIASWPLPGGLAYATSRGGPPDLTDQWAGTSRGATRLLSQAVTLARRGATTDLGHLLAPAGVRYVAAVRRPAPLDASVTGAAPVAVDGGQGRSAPAAGLDAQLDMQVVTRTAAMTIYENTAWAPIRFRLPDGAATAAMLDDPRVARGLTLGGSVPVLAAARPPTTFSGAVPADAMVEVAEAPSSHWHLTAGGRRAVRRPAFATANLFSTTAGGSGTLRYDTPVGWWAALAAEAGLWSLAIATVVGGRRRPAPDAGHAIDTAEGMQPVAVGASG